MSQWQPVKVTITMGDDLGQFEGFTLGDRWNGWAMPSFTKEQGLRIAEWTDALAERYPDGSVERVLWDEGQEAFVMEDPTYPHAAGEPIPEEDLVAGFWCTEVGQQLFGIGAYKWTWEDVTSPAAATRV